MSVAIATRLTKIERHLVQRRQEPPPYVDPVTWAESVTHLTLDPWQRDVLTSSSKRILMLCCRQAGKSSVAALKAAHTAIYRPGSLILILSPSLRQSQELFRRVRGFLGLSPLQTTLMEDNKLSLELRNRSRVVSLPGDQKTIRGYASVTLLILDEASRILDETYYSIRPMISVSNGALICLSTPYGKRGFFYHEWTEGKAWERTMITADQVSRISAEFLEHERRSMPRAWFDAEYLCRFTDTEENVFTHGDVMAMLDTDDLPFFQESSHAG